MKLNEDSLIDGYQEPPKFTIIDTSLVEGEEPFKVRELRRLPADANITFGLTHHSSNMVSDSSSEEQDASERLSDGQGNCGRVTADVKDIEMVSVDSLQNMVAANGHSSNGNDDKIGLIGIYGLKTKTEGRKYLSPVSKRRRLASCSNEQTSRCGFSFSKGGGLEKEKSKLLPTSSKPTAVAVGDTFQTKTITSCSTKEKPPEQKMDASNSLTNDGPNVKISMSTLIEDKSFDCEADAVAEVHSKITVDERKFGKERAQISGLINSNKLETPHDDKASGSICIMTSDNHGGMKADEAPSISESDMACDPSETTGRPVSQQSEHALQVNPRRHGTRNRPPTAKALEAVAFGLLGSGKRKGDPKSTMAKRPSQRARKSTKDSVSTVASRDAGMCSMDAEAQR
uniref:Uncharacterized protein n=1 Tax=Arundo donax TaxID=35708 RepID=A0A0A9D0L1_ARUDO